jgi:hypothetical protein
MQVLLLTVELIALYILSQRLTQAVFDLVVLLVRSRTVGITVISLLTFPGTVIHELSHMFTAEILGVRTGKLTLVPEGLETEEVKTGSVMISHSDPFRRYAIGLAPIFTGLLTISALSYILFNPSILPANQLNIGIFNFQFSIFNIVILYLLLAVSNAMFSSKEDLKGFIPFLIALGAVIGAAYYAGLRIGITGALLSFVTKILDALVKSLGIVLAINIAGLLITRGFTLLAEKLTRRKFIRH